MKITKIQPIYKMKERRHQPTLRHHYSQIEKCYNCDGSYKSTQNCELGKQAYSEKNKKCGWRIAVDNDLEKISKGDTRHLTFPVLRRIIECEV